MYRTIIKGLIDKVASFALLVILAPAIIIVTILLFIANKGAPFFIQKRPGKNEKIFNLVKFKTMNDKKNEIGELLPDKDRLTYMGKIIRKTSIDELPQLFNVLKGDMSFIGPRPLLVKYLPFYTDFERKRHKVRPGITGLSQVNGRNLILWDDRIKMDVEYAENISFMMDVKILFSTIMNVIHRKDIMVVPAEMGRVTLDIRRDPKNAGKYDNNGFLIDNNQNNS